jgi:hypothetical protein
MCMSKKSFFSLQFSYTPSSDALSNRVRFPNLWRTRTSESSLALSVISVMKEFKWKKLKIVTQNEDLFLQVRNLLCDNLPLCEGS